MGSTATWRVGDLAAQTGLTVRTLHYYDALGLVSPASRSAGGHRLYGSADVERLYAVLVLRRMGLTTAQIGARLDDPEWTLTAVARSQRAALDAELAALGELRSRLDALLAADASSQDGPLGLIDAMQQLSAGSPPVVQVLALLPYVDVAQAQQRLVEMFGFTAGALDRTKAGVVVHASVLAGNGLVHLHPPTADMAPPGDQGPGSAMIVATIVDLDRHLAHAVEHGARVTYGPAVMPYGVREYGARDHAGHHWSFQESVTPQEEQ